MSLFKDRKFVLRFKKHILKYLQIYRIQLHCSCYSYMADIMNCIYLPLRLKRVEIFVTRLNA